MASSQAIVMQELDINKEKVEESKAMKDFSDEDYWLKLAITPKEYTLHRTAIQAAKAKAGEDIYNEDSKLEPLTFVVTGCDGNNSEEAKKVAKLIANIKGFCFVKTGDSFYQDGLSSWFDERLSTEFYQKFATALKDTFAIVALGNHDHGQRYSLGWINKTPIEKERSKRAAYQVWHTFCSAKKKSDKVEYFLDPDKVKYLQEEHIDKETLMKKGIKWLCPSTCCVYKLPEYNTEIYTIDTSTLLLDYLNIHANLEKLIKVRYDKLEKINKERELKKNPKEFQKEYNILEQEMASLTERLKKDAPQQAEWFINRSKKNPSARKIIAQHHPYYSSAGKDHISLYLNAQDLKFVKELLEIKDENISVNKLLHAMAEKESIQSDILMHSDDHHLGYYKNEKLCQINAAASAPSLHDRSEFQEIKQSPFYLKEHGCVSVSLTSKKKESPISINFHSISGKTWRFINESKNFDPVYDWKNIPDETHQGFYKKIKDTVMEVCYKFLLEYAKQKKESSVSYMWYAKAAILSDNFSSVEITAAINTLNYLLYPTPLSLFNFLKVLLAELKPKLLLRVDQALSKLSFTISDVSFSVKNLAELINTCEKYIKSTPPSPTVIDLQDDCWQVILSTSNPEIIIPRSPTSCKA